MRFDVTTSYFVFCGFSFIGQELMLNDVSVEFR